MPKFADLVRREVSRIPRGKVATYSCIAALAGNPKAAQSAGNALGAPGDLVGWHRVVKAGGKLADGVASEQRGLLAGEGVRFIENSGRVDLKCHLWKECM